MILRTTRSRTSAICTFSFRFPAVFGGFWVSRNLKTRNLETLKESLEIIQKITSSAQVAYFLLTRHVRFLGNGTWVSKFPGFLVFIGFYWFLRFRKQ